ncbi:hypothetical protein [Nocardia iowensis]
MPSASGIHPGGRVPEWHGVHKGTLGNHASAAESSGSRARVTGLAHDQPALA